MPNHKTKDEDEAHESRLMPKQTLVIGDAYYS